MRLTKYVHSCMLVEDGDTRILLDPGTYTHGFEELTGLSAVLITHQHPDHVDEARLGVLLKRNPDAVLCSDEATAKVLAERDITARTVTSGDIIEAGLEVTVYGTDHAVIHPEIPRVPNVGYLIAGRIFHPGDAFTVPDVPVEILGLPTAAPWLKLSEAVDFLRAISPRIAIPIHEGLLSRPALYYGHYQRLAPEGTDVRILEPDGHIKV